MSTLTLGMLNFLNGIIHHPVLETDHNTLERYQDENLIKRWVVTSIESGQTAQDCSRKQQLTSDLRTEPTVLAILGFLV